MATTFFKNTIHLVFRVKCSSIRIRECDLDSLFRYIGGIISKLNAIPFEIGGMPDHMHILCTVPKTMALCDFVCKIKCSSSRWLKTVHERYIDFCWQDGYGAFSVSPSVENRTARYIRNQAEHHKNVKFTDEYKSVLDAYGVDYDESSAFND